MRIENVKELLVEHLRDLYDAEKLLVKNLPKMAKSAGSEDLREAILSHLQETEQHVVRLEQAFEHLGENAKSKPCAGMHGLVEEGKEILNEDAAETCKDLGIIAAAQKVEHYEISAYGTARALAEKLEEQEVVELLEETLEEEKQADSKLTGISMTLLESAEMETEIEVEETEDSAQRRAPAAAGRTQTGQGRKAGTR